nr:hypothetical protein Iba_chr07aCG14060 [Ipomoea batatas]GMD16827.1 hypothetical protein Iba_chr07cCG13160 [Ipomoea batatas]
MICQSWIFFTEQTQRKLINLNSASTLAYSAFAFHPFPRFFSRVSTTVFAVAARVAMMETMTEIVAGSTMSECRLRLIEREGIPNDMVEKWEKPNPKWLKLKVDVDGNRMGTAC